MAIAYVPPGVINVTRGEASPLIPQGLNPIIPALVGRARGYQTFTEQAILTGVAETTLEKTGITTPLTSVVKGTTNEVISTRNYVVTQTSPSSGTVDGDEVTTVRRIAYADAPTLAGAAGDLTGEYRYAVAWIFDDGHSGIDPDKTASITLTSQEAQLSAIPTASPPTGATGRAIYRSKNLGTSGSPIWGPWYLVTEIEDLVTTTFTDNLDDETVAANDIAEPGIESGETLYFQYDFADEDYFQPTYFTDLNDIIAKYGTPFDSSGNVNSELSFGANLAFINGATQMILVAVPNDGDTTDIANGLTKLLEEEDIDIVVALDGSATTVSAVSAHTVAAAGLKRYRVGIVGRDGVAATVTSDTLRAGAESLGSTTNGRLIEMVSPARFNYYNPALRVEVPVGGQYMAAALAGMYAARSPQDSINRAVVAGFNSLGVKYTSESTKNAEAASGLTVLEEKGGVIRVRHAISTNVSDINNREFYITLCEHDMLHDVLNAIRERIVGKIRANALASVNVSSIIRQVLERKIQTGVIFAYSGLTAKPTTGDPTSFDVNWQWKPNYIINYINVSFSININTGATAITGVGGVGANNLIL